MRDWLQVGWLISFGEVCLDFSDDLLLLEELIWICNWVSEGWVLLEDSSLVVGTFLSLVREIDWEFCIRVAI